VEKDGERDVFASLAFGMALVSVSFSVVSLCPFVS